MFAFADTVFKQREDRYITERKEKEISYTERERERERKNEIEREKTLCKFVKKISEEKTSEREEREKKIKHRRERKRLSKIEGREKVNLR